MKKEDLDFLADLREDQNKDKTDFAELFFKYIRYWKWFVVSIIVCLTVAAIYLKKTTPIYEVDAKILLKDDQKEGSSATENLSTFQDLGLFNIKNNADNELEILKTSDLMKIAVRKLGIYALSEMQICMEKSVLFLSGCLKQCWTHFAVHSTLR